ncbi:tryptophan synthase subunit alpha [Sulfobacillus thermosulfidooxidans]|uniref:tryptophan synthase subunit alpha n=1 Tax=Sulfobacillus thermosulfidooxidans TaxID=28034 RepID=UPI00096BB922|nr:tryptophan synthase subunit alpha [Sulfobacillus thermosulfidooxidans]OLZ09724.1 tryptophan synthase subunit alpha [Sulfobacillus thermosulfidooxidans]OLZ15969.1 tryptophan synthase subunit alpha [Sulfobacillus thermosulfidooxidans]OLZ18183.1 tryptophan synthase subunit alpha [Sulfobacillus thermosulfidooxidans]
MINVGTSVAQVFERTKSEGRAALIPYVTAGHPHLRDLEELVHAMNDAGADIIEIGIPFSDPLADGPVLQKAATKALNNGTRIRDVLQATEMISAHSVPIVYLTYFNPVFHYGVRDFLKAARDSGVKGIIIPDLPWEESDEVFHDTQELGMSLIPLVAPTSTDAHIASLAKATGFVYGVSVTGVTGVRQEVDAGVKTLVERVKRQISLPLAIGFGISTPEHARYVGSVADGVIVGSALVRRIDEAGGDAAKQTYEFVAALRKALSD